MTNKLIKVRKVFAKLHCPYNGNCPSKWDEWLVFPYYMHENSPCIHCNFAYKREEHYEKYNKSKKTNYNI